MGRKAVTIDTFASEVDKILQEYGDDVEKNMKEIVRSVAKKGATAVKNQARSAQKGKKYPGTWTYEVEPSRLRTEATIDSKKPGLPHLLEHGHALRNGGRTGAFTHIAPVEQEVISDFERQVMAKL